MPHPAHTGAAVEQYPPGGLEWRELARRRVDGSMPVDDLPVAIGIARLATAVAGQTAASWHGIGAKGFHTPKVVYLVPCSSFTRRLAHYLYPLDTTGCSCRCGITDSLRVIRVTTVGLGLVGAPIVKESAAHCAKLRVIGSPAGGCIAQLSQSFWADASVMCYDITLH